MDGIGRKSYLGYLLRNRLNDNYVDVSFYGRGTQAHL